MAKLHATEAAQDVIDRAVQLLGGRGVVVGAMVEHLYRAIRPLRIYEGTSEIQRTIIGRAIDDVLRGLGGEQLGHGHLDGGAGRAVIAQVGRAQGEQAGRVDRGRHVGELVARDLLVDEPAAEHLALLRPGQGLLQADTGKAVGPGGQENALAVEVEHDGLEALVLGAHQVGHRHAAVVEVQGGGVRTQPAHLLQSCLGEAGCAFVHQQQRHPAGARPAGANGHGVEVGSHPRGDEGLGAAEHEVVAGDVEDLPCCGLHQGGARFWT